MATIRDVANLAGVSSTTVSHVVNKTRFVSEDVRLRVLAAMEELEYRPNALAQSLRSGYTHTIALLLPDSANPFFAELGRAIEMEAFKAGYNLILCNTEADFEKEDVYIDVLMKKQVDGVVFCSVGSRADSFHTLSNSKLPVVVLDRELPGIEMDTVVCDNRQGGYLATRHLLELGHRRIGCIAGPSQVTPSAQRVTGYRAALEEAGVLFDEGLVIRGDFHPEMGLLATRRLLKLKKAPTAIFSCNDMMALGILRAAAEFGASVPGDLSVVGFDDIELASYAIPSLSTICQPKVEMSSTVVKLLLERIANMKLTARRIVLPVSIIVRQSTTGIRVRP
jgi:LacI family transcriptional regulator